MRRGSSAPANEVNPAEEAQPEDIEQDVEAATEEVSEIEEETGASNATTMIEALSKFAEQAFKMDLDEDLDSNIDEQPLSPIHGQSTENNNQQKIKWILFDCDNTLVLSETLAFMASFDLVNEVLEYKQINHRYHRDELLIHFMGLSFSAMCRKMAKQFNFEWTAADATFFEQREEAEVIKLFHKGLKPMPGIFQVLVRIVREMRYNIAIVSSSSYARINAALETTNLRMFFPNNYIFSAKSCLENQACKPDPAIYLHALEKLGVQPEDCVCIEDSRGGAMAAARAGIPCIGFLGSFTCPSLKEQLWTDFSEEEDGCTAILWEWNKLFDILNALEQL
ncbi:hypothetical protein DV738_g3788, partial [Chaetothyriales sp. CBS 135597]